MFAGVLDVNEERVPRRRHFDLARTPGRATLSL